MKIIRLEAENFKRLRAVSITPDGTLQQISGRNAAGKTSVLDAVWAALGGKAASPERPIRDGEKSAEVRLDLGDITVRRRWTSDEKSTLIVESKDGSASYKSPQAMLDKLVGGLSFDPLAFTRADPKKQADMLRTIAGLDTTLLDQQRKAAYDKRTEANRALKAEQARLDAIPIVDAPDDLITWSGLSSLVEEAREVLKANQQKRAWLVEVSASIGLAQKHIAEKQAELAALIEEQKRLVPEVEALNDPDLEKVKQQIADAEKVNAAVRIKKSRAEQVEACARANQSVLRHEDTLKELDARKAELLAGAQFPVPSLSVDGDTPTYHGFPLAQASGAEQLRVSLAVAAALNPRLKVVLVRDGSLLDSEGLAMVAAWAEEKGMQIWLERVSDGAGPGILIEDGMVVAAPDPAMVEARRAIEESREPMTPMELQRELPSEADEIQGRDAEMSNDFPGAG